ncbi:MAG: hypothetical protein ACPGU7_11970 [Gammaproteobacteria bacterium]
MIKRRDFLILATGALATSQANAGLFDNIPNPISSLLGGGMNKGGIESFMHSVGICSKCLLMAESKFKTALSDHDGAKEAQARATELDYLKLNGDETTKIFEGNASYMDSIDEEKLKAAAKDKEAKGALGQAYLFTGLGVYFEKEVFDSAKAVINAVTSNPTMLLGSNLGVAQVAGVAKGVATTVPSLTSATISAFSTTSAFMSGNEIPVPDISAINEDLEVAGLDITPDLLDTALSVPIGG